jgi:hypothetical protein
MPRVETGDQAEKIDFDALYPADHQQSQSEASMPVRLSSGQNARVRGNRPTAFDEA